MSDVDKTWELYCAERQENERLRAQLAAAHGLLREAVAMDEAARSGMVVNNPLVDWMKRAKKEVGDAS